MTDIEVNREIDLVRALKQCPLGATVTHLLNLTSEFLDEKSINRTLHRLLNQEVVRFLLVSNVTGRYCLPENEVSTLDDWLRKSSNVESLPVNTIPLVRGDTVDTQDSKTTTHKVFCMESEPALVFKAGEEVLKPYFPPPMYVNSFKSGKLKPESLTGKVGAVMFEHAKTVFLSVSSVRQLCPSINKIDISRVLSQLSVNQGEYPAYFEKKSLDNKKAYRWSGYYSSVSSSANTPKPVLPNKKHSVTKNTETLLTIETIQSNDNALPDYGSNQRLETQMSVKPEVKPPTVMIANATPVVNKGIFRAGLFTTGEMVLEMEDGQVIAISVENTNHLRKLFQGK